MAGVRKFSEGVVEAAERVADVADAAQGKGIRRGRMSTRWLILPAAGAGLYALATSGAFSSQAKGVLQQARARASDLPEELLDRVQQATGADNGGTRQSSRSSSGRRKTSRQRSRKTSSAR
jgi:hypothetical protein